MYRIYANGRHYEFGTLTDAKAMAEYIFQQTGAIVGITQ